MNWLTWPAWLKTRAVVDRETGCWLWLKTRSPSGYGRTESRGETYAHRAVWRLFDRPLAKNQVLHHRCSRRDCVNPAHLELAARSEHMRDHAQAWTLPPEVMRSHRAASQRAWQVGQQAAGRCRQCIALAVPGLRQCETHRRASNAARARIRAAR